MFDMLARDTVTGQRARAVATIEGKVQDLFEAKKIEAKVEFEKQDVRTLGNLGTQSKPTGYKGTGSLTMHFVSSWHRKMAIKYMKTGIATYFTLLIENDDKSSSVGKQTTVLYDCCFDSVVLAKLDVDSTALDEEAPFTFTRAELLNEFGNPVY